MAERRLWVVNHPYQYRKFLDVNVYPKGGPITRGLIWSEWPEQPQGSGVLTPTLPDRFDQPSNVDPLVIGPYMYFDYCRKGSRTANRRKANELEANDMVLFGCVNAGEVLIDTVFVIGEYRTWPLDSKLVPDWPNVDDVAQKMHFHDYARQQHSEVYNPRVVRARSYRGLRYVNDTETPLYAWVPYFKESTPPLRPFTLNEASSPYQQLKTLYHPKGLEDMFKGSFAVIDVSNNELRTLFDALVLEAAAQCGGIAVQVDLVTKVALDTGYADAQTCSHGCDKHENDMPEDDGC